MDEALRIRILTLTQPYATLIALGLKLIETRSWSTSHRGLLAIHAGKGPGQLGWMQMQHLCRHVEPFKSALAELLHDRHPADVLPLGQVVAVVDLWDMAPLGGGSLLRTVDRHLITPLSVQEQAFGDYGPGRWGWMLGNVRPLATPIAVKGGQGLRWWTPPAGFVLPPVQYARG
jgi:hypothetical protein